ncbi:serine/threonine-protein kinase [Janibacter anophelis]|uniref:serine/threonine-protein kinase n=1 Tax=Janibacter anophelis TaxID=319054 RepID=UPI0013B055A6|nr:serine/threonine-protein kinase [Janibacter anophelis]
MLKGERLDRPTYTFLHTLGEGNTAVCVVAEHAIFGCQVVQKTVSMLGLKDAFVVSEPELLKRIEHDRIVDVWEAQWEPSPEWVGLEAITFTTPYYAGGSVYTALMEGYEFGVGGVIRVGLHVLAALDHMHAGNRLLHRDVKPANIMLSADRRDAYLGDLGSAAYFMNDQGGVDARAGSPLYLPPEAGVTGSVTVRADLYSLGMTLLEMLNGRLPYEALDPISIDKRLSEGQRSLPDKHFILEPWVPKPLATFIRSLTNSDPEKRPVSAAEALRALRDLRVVDWERTGGAGRLGTWVGSWPPDVERSERRIHEVTLAPVGRRSDAGRIKATARWCRPGRGWRNYAKLTRTLDPTTASLAKFFRSVEDAAQSAPTR